VGRHGSQNGASGSSDSDDENVDRDDTKTEDEPEPDSEQHDDDGSLVDMVKSWARGREGPDEPRRP
jgi:hypothetical protein